MKMFIRPLTLLLFIFTAVTAFADQNNSTQSIGAYTAGCIRNAAALPKDGKGYQVIRLGRGRFFAHPETLDFITTLSEKVNEELGGLLLIADIAQQTGGPMPDDHSSHQTGLDADILFWQHPVAKERTLSVKERQYINPRSVLFPGGYGIDPNKWSTMQEQILMLAASDPRVDRIFINPVIKRKLCANYGGQDWLAKMRPWYGHDGHFHVRLKCPKGSVSCEAQAPLPNFGDGCDELITWFREDGTVKTRKKSGSYVPKKLPDECIAIMNGKHE